MYRYAPVATRLSAVTTAAHNETAQTKRPWKKKCRKTQKCTTKTSEKTPNKIVKAYSRLSTAVSQTQKTPQKTHVTLTFEYDLEIT